jgi:hypothetical protein
MPNKITESEIENFAIELLEKQEYQYILPEGWPFKFF